MYSYERPGDGNTRIGDNLRVDSGRLSPIIRTGVVAAA